MPPSRYLGYDWPEWGETDCMLDRAVAEHDRRLCSCGCGYWASETQGDDNDGEFAHEVVVCHARAAIEGGDDDKLPKGALVYARRKADGED